MATSKDSKDSKDLRDLKDSKDLKGFERSLMNHLNYGEINKNLLKNVSSEIVNLKKNGLKIDQASIKGKGRADRILINGIVDPIFWSKFHELGLGFRRFEVFAYGIIRPEGFRFNAELRLNEKL